MFKFSKENTYFRLFFYLENILKCYRSPLSKYDKHQDISSLWHGLSFKQIKKLHVYNCGKFQVYIFKGFRGHLLRKCALVITGCKYILRIIECLITLNFNENDN